MLKRFLLLYIFLFSTFSLFSQFNKNGLPFFKNYSPEEYRGHNEIWCITEDIYGQIFFGTSDGEIIKYNGVNFAKYSTNNKAQIFSFTKNSKGNIFISSYNDFGYLDLNHQKYISLLHEKVNNISFRKTYTDSKQNVYFCSKTVIYKYSKEGIISKIKLPEKSWLSFYINDKIYISNEDSGLIVLENESLRKSDVFDVLKGKYVNIYFQINSNNHLVITSEGESWMLSDNNLKPFSNKLLDTIISNGLYYIEKSPDYLFFCTLNNGIYITDYKFRPIYHLSVNEGLLSNTITYAYYKNDDNTLWLASINGLIKIELNPKLHFFSEESGLKGNIYSIERYKNKLYVATDDGLFIQTNISNKLTFSKIALNIKGTTYINSIKSIIKNNNEEVLWLGLLTGLYEINNKNEFKKISDLSPNYVYQNKNLNKVYIATENELYIAHYENNNWVFNKFNNFNGFINSIIEDNSNRIWFSTKTNGVYCIDKDNLIHYTINNELPNDKYAQIVFFDNNIFTISNNSLYTFNYNKNIFEPYNFTNELKPLKSIKFTSINSGINKQLIFQTNNNIIYYLYKKLNNFYIDTTSFYRFPFTSIYHILFDPIGIIWFGTNKGIYSYNTNVKTKAFEFKPLINEMKLLKNDSILFNGVYYDSLLGILLKQPKSPKITIPYKFNSFQFTYSCPFYQNEEGIEYSYMLKAFDNQWSSWTKDIKVKYTNINEGIYTFLLKTRNSYKQESNIVSYTFEIKSPWYRTFWAYLLYVLLSIFVFFVSIKLYTRKLEADKRKLEKIVEERTAEVVQQKNEIEQKIK